MHFFHILKALTKGLRACQPAIKNLKIFRKIDVNFKVCMNPHFKGTPAISVAGTVILFQKTRKRTENMNTTSMLYSKLRKVGDNAGDSDSSCTTKRTPNTKHVNFITLTVKLSHYPRLPLASRNFCSGTIGVIASNAMTRTQTIICFSVREPDAALSPLAMRFECVHIPVFC